MSAVFTPTRARLTVAQFQKMGDAGIMPPESRLELVDGELIEMAPIGPRHMHAVNRLNRALVAAVGEAAIVSVQNPVALGDHSETQPDLALLRPQSDSEARLPTQDDVLLLIEVADTTLQYDRTTKLALYAQFGSARSGSSISSTAFYKFIASPTTAHIESSSNAAAMMSSRRLHCRTPRSA